MPDGNVEYCGTRLILVLIEINHGTLTGYARCCPHVAIEHSGFHERSVARGFEYTRGCKYARGGSRGVAHVLAFGGGVETDHRRAGDVTRRRSHDALSMETGQGGGARSACVGTLVLFVRHLLRAADCIAGTGTRQRVVA